LVWHRGIREASAFTPSTIEEAASALHKNLVLGGASEEEVAGLLDAAASSAEAYWRWWLDYERERAKREYVGPIAFAISYAHLGEKDQAFEWLEKAYEVSHSHYVRSCGKRTVGPPPEDPRFHDLRRMNLEP